MPYCQSELSLASQEELTDVINFLSGAPIKHRLISDDDANASMAESHMTPIDSGLGSIYSVPLSNITVPSSAAACPSEETEYKESCNKSQSETKERIKTPVLDLCEGMNSSKGTMVTTETQTSPSTETCPVLFVKSANSDNESQPQQKLLAKDNGGDGVYNPVLELPSDNAKSKSEIKTCHDAEKKTDTPHPVSPSQAKQDGSDLSIKNADVVSTADTPTLRVTLDQHLKQSKTPSPVLVTVSSEECPDDKTVTISESLRSVWENASPPSDPSDTILEGSLLHKKDIHGSQDTLYHSCWSLSDFPGNEKNDEANEDAKSLNESLLPSNSGPGLMDLGLKWSSYGSSIHGNPVWANIPSASASNWNQSQESLTADGSGRGKTVFSLGLGITGPDLLAAARGGSCEAMPTESVSFIPNIGKPWSVEDLAQKNPWSSRDSSPPPLWAKTASLTEDTLRPSHHRPPLPPQHYSDPFPPRENWWPQGRGAVPLGYPHPSSARYHTNLQRQRAFDNMPYGKLGTLHRGRGTAGAQSAFQPVPTSFRKQGQKLPQAHLQVPSHYGAGHGSQYKSNPRF